MNKRKIVAHQSSDSSPFLTLANESKRTNKDQETKYFIFFFFWNNQPKKAESGVKPKENVAVTKKEIRKTRSTMTNQKGRK